MKEKRINRQLLTMSKEYPQANFTWILTLLISLVFLLNSFSFRAGEIKPYVLALFGAYFITALLQLFIAWRIKRDILLYGDIQRGTRRLGYIQLFSLVTGNVFTAAFSLHLINERKTPEYTFAVYMALTQLFVIAISAFNVFKPYVTDSFPMAMLVLLLVLVFQVAVLIIVATTMREGQLPKWLGLIAIFTALTALTGNLFALLLGISLWMKVRSTESSRIAKWDATWGKITRNTMAVFGMFFIILMLAISVVSRYTFDYDLAVENDYANILQAPSLVYPFGTDNFGRDVFSRIIFGARISLLVGFASTVIPAVIGGCLGGIAGYYSNRTDNWIMRLLDVLYAIPGILLAIAIIAAFGANTVNLIIALSLGSIPTYARTMRANVLMVSNYDFVDSARALGASDFSIIFKQIIPNSLAPMIVKATLTIGGAVIATSSLSYLGLGVEPHIPEWGNILRVGSTYLESNSYLAIFPGLAIILLVLSFNFLGDGLRDALDPRLD
ncbi:ABC transporter permease [Sporosarcina sp. NCCP-2222]|uniref:ABC transporter permease n=1 Tax=Sporosarcina sp. NCCP-2222 TaxID=2935073 RepID=UPI002085F536|nr:ABC transporter permease [Sporosarcina sp. NCCP-2222]GKV57323.1 ABC transporter permease [Sporosarcina sp. NCCP-2222]